MGKPRHVYRVGAVVAATVALAACGGSPAATSNPPDTPGSGAAKPARSAAHRSTPPATHHTASPATSRSTAASATSTPPATQPAPPAAASTIPTPPAPPTTLPTTAPAPCASARCVVDHTFPGATISYGPRHPGAAGALTLIIRLAPSVKPPSGTADQQAAAYDDLGWRAGMAFADARAIDPRIGAFQLTYANGTSPAGANGNDFHGGATALPAGARPTPMPKLDSISLGLALRQMRSNLEVLDRVLGPGAVTGQQIRVVALDLGRARFGLDVAVELKSGAVLHHHLGDLVDGLDTGLGEGAQSLIEGTRISATAGGQAIAHGWTSARMMSGSVGAGGGINYPGDDGTLASFPDITGGPKAVLSAPGG